MCSLIFKGFVGLYIFAFLIYLIGTFGWFGADEDPLSGVFLIILGQPWTQFVDLLPRSLALAGAILAPAVNAGLIYAICRAFR